MPPGRPSLLPGPRERGAGKPAAHVRGARVVGVVAAVSAEDEAVAAKVAVVAASAQGAAKAAVGKAAVGEGVVAGAAVARVASASVRPVMILSIRRARR